MSTAKRRCNSGVIQQLFAEPWRFPFFQAIRILENFFYRQGDNIDDIVPQRIRFRNSLSLGFPAGDLESALLYSPEGDVLNKDGNIDQVAMEDIGQVEITPAFTGLLGIQGVLPLHYTELLSQRETFHRDHAARAFLDIFTTRAVALHYQAWRKYRPEFQYETDHKERFIPLMLSLSGLGLPGLRDRMADGQGDVFDHAAAYYSGIIRERPVSAATLQSLLSDYFNVDINVEQFVGKWIEVPATHITRLGMANACLGSTALSGEYIWQQDLVIRLEIGPLRRKQFDTFLPGGDASLALSKWLTLLTGSTLEYEIALVLAPEDVRGAGIGGEHSARLGWDSYVCTRPVADNSAKVCYEIKTLH